MSSEPAKEQPSARGPNKMKGLILVGGFGTRLRPLTFSKPKPLVEMCNKPQLVHQIEALAAAGVDEVVLAIGFGSNMLDSFQAEWGPKLGVKITCSIEDTPMGTAGPLALAKDILAQANDFFVLNSDVICEFPLKALRDFHRSHGKLGTIMVTQVHDPSKYGVVVSDPGTGLIDCFVEKPKQYISDKINAGIYCFNKKILDRIPSRPTSIEKEIFPAVAGDEQLYAMVLEGFWMDIGQPADFLTGTRLFLNHLASCQPEELTGSSLPTTIITGHVMIHPSATIGKGCVFGNNVVIGPNAKVLDGCKLNNTTVMEGAVIKEHTWIMDSIIGWHSVVGKWCRIEGVSVLGEDVVIADELFLTEVRILPHKAVRASVYEKGTIIM